MDAQFPKAIVLLGYSIGGDAPRGNSAAITVRGGPGGGDGGGGGSGAGLAAPHGSAPMRRPRLGGQ